MRKLALTDEQYGPLLPFVKNESMTDINWNGTELWVDDLKRGRFKVKGFTMDEGFIARFYTKVSNLMNVQFNQQNPVLEAETDQLRLSIVHDSVTNTGFSISIRKTPSVRRMSRKSMIETGYAPERLIVFFKNCVRAGCTMVAGGLPGVGKTEFIKWLTYYIPPNERVFTIEDTLELRYAAINPGKDCVEIKVDDKFGYSDALKASKRQLPTWVLVAESRGEEVVYLMENISSGVHCLTTAHMDGVMTLPDRFANMGADININDVYSFIDIGVYIDIQKTNGKITRKITQVACYSRDKGENKTTMLYQDGRFLLDYKDFPGSIRYRFQNAKINDPFVDALPETVDNSAFEAPFDDILEEFNKQQKVEESSQENEEKEPQKKEPLQKEQKEKRK